MTQTIQVLIPVNLDTVYDYKVPEGIKVKELDFVKVSFGNNVRVGLVWSCNKASYNESKLKYIKGKVKSLNHLFPQDKKFIQLFSKYNMVSLGNVLSLITARDERYFTSEQTFYLTINQELESKSYKLTDARQKVLNFLQQHNKAPKNEVLLATNVSPAVITGMLKANILNQELESKDFVSKQIDYNYNSVNLNPNQQNAVDFLNNKLSDGKFSTTLLNGVTGSGKTEVFFKVIEDVLKQGKQVLILIPEIALTEQMVQRFYNRFNASCYEWNAEQTIKNKKHIWLSCLSGQNCVVIGARSALFLPFKNLGLIVVDEEHDGSYKQEEGVVYNARDMAVLKAKVNNIPIVLSSATASLETFVNVKKGNYFEVELKSRFNYIEKPNIKAVLHKKRSKDGNKYFSQELLSELQTNLNNKEQSLLFVNKRGYASSLHCVSCSYTLQCSNCSTFLVEHKREAKLKCHYCGHVENTTSTCPSCLESNGFERFGVGIENAYEILSSELPKARIAIASSDTLKTKEKIKEFMALVQNKEVDIILATQILAKGHHFKDLTFVGVIDADLENNSLDLRASEKTFQVLSQVIGRAGREKEGRGILQINSLENKTLPFVLTQDKEGFIDHEIMLRQQAFMPPFSQLIAIIISSSNANLLESVVNGLCANKPNDKNIEVFGPVSPLIFKLRGRYRKRFLLKFAKDYGINARKFVNKWLTSTTNVQKVKITIDVDPISFY